MKFHGAVVTVPAAFANVQPTAREKAATDASVNFLKVQLLDEAGAAAATTTSLPPISKPIVLPNSL